MLKYVKITESERELSKKLKNFLNHRLKMLPYVHMFVEFVTVQNILKTLKNQCI